VRRLVEYDRHGVVDLADRLDRWRGDDGAAGDAELLVMRQSPANENGAWSASWMCHGSLPPSAGENRRS
jgi:hypothetical protein